MEFYLNEDFKDIEVNGRETSVPEDWDVIKVKDFENIKIINGLSLKTNEMKSKSEGIYPIIKIGNIYKNKIIIKEDNKYSKNLNEKYKLLKNDLVIGLSGATAGKAGVFDLDMECILNQRNIIVRTGNVFFNLIYNNKIKNPLIETQRSMGIPNISSLSLKEIEFSVPNKPEQEAIANTLTKQEEIIEELEKVVSLKEKMMTFLQQELLSGRIRIDEKGSFYKNVDFKTEIVNGRETSIPMDWEVVKIGEKRLNISKENVNLENSDKDYKYYATGDIEQGKLVSYEIVNSKNIVSRAKKVIPDNSVWFARMKETRKELYFKKREEDILLSTGMVGLVSDDSIDMKLVYEIIKSDKFNMLKDLHCMGSTQKAINDTNLKKIELFFPDKFEQERIAKTLTTLEEEIEERKELIEKEKKKFKYLQQELLSGRVRIRI